MAGSSKNSDKRNDNSYPEERRPARSRTFRERAVDTFEAISKALNPRTHIEPGAQKLMKDANENYGGGARRRRIDEVVDQAVEGRPPSNPENRQNRR